jgi:flagellar assembly factor FliW
VTTAAVRARASRRVSTRLFGPIEFHVDDVIHFPAGIPGFEEAHEFLLLTAAPGCHWLQSIELPHLAFLTVEAGLISPGSWPELPGALAIVTLPRADRDEASANLRAPLVIDLSARLGRQHVPAESPHSIIHVFDLGKLLAGAAD